MSKRWAEVWVLKSENEEVCCHAWTQSELKSMDGSPSMEGSGGEVEGFSER